MLHKSGAKSARAKRGAAPPFEMLPVVIFVDETKSLSLEQSKRSMVARLRLGGQQLMCFLCIG